ncbi:MAG: LPXTG cell wall anchor domain-containing protein [Acidimicrobiaceae bacterium]|nr:LPXTG cell wall anchor domain-containing protein [Acidimicrobiaceae bacterium]MCO4833296.1 LPXTG cell wall anchor domain-containing protein [Acidimicrobiaceae bacterium]MDG1086120.1 LPXTG cell wall anchor domain-containing protein [Acidimicrobiales bacterium]
MITVTEAGAVGEYQSREPVGTEEEVFTEELTPADCPEEVLGLAITGSNVNMPIAVGGSLIGAGGLLVAAARKRRNELS